MECIVVQVWIHPGRLWYIGFPVEIPTLYKLKELFAFQDQSPMFPF